MRSREKNVIPGHLSNDLSRVISRESCVFQVSSSENRGLGFKGKVSGKEENVIPAKAGIQFQVQSLRFKFKRKWAAFHGRPKKGALKLKNVSSFESLVSSFELNQRNQRNQKNQIVGQGFSLGSGRALSSSEAKDCSTSSAGQALPLQKHFQEAGSRRLQPACLRVKSFKFQVKRKREPVEWLPYSSF